jgi:hypothetical protein
MSLFLQTKRESLNEIIVDILSVERNFVLVNANLIGGPNEKMCASRMSSISDKNVNLIIN